MKLVAEAGRWATKDNSMIFSNVIWLCDKDEMKLFHLIDEDRNEIHIENMEDYLVE